MLFGWSLVALGLLNFVQAEIQGPIHNHVDERADESGPAWDYLGEDGALGPNDWSKAYPECNGTKQSPIFINQQSWAGVLGRFTFINYDVERKGMILVNNGHTVQLELPRDDPNPPCIEGAGLGARYCFTQLHFHWGLNNSNGSEHVIRGQRESIMEMHLVHTNPSATQDGNAGIAVLGVLFETNCVQIAGYSNYRNIINGLSEVAYKGQSTVLNESITLSFLLPRMRLLRGRSYYRYNGSLTTPPCTEGVIWSVFEEPLCMQENQLQIFRGLYRTAKGEPEKRMAPNFRPLQQLNDRTVRRGLDSLWGRSN